MITLKELDERSNDLTAPISGKVDAQTFIEITKFRVAHGLTLSEFLRYCILTVLNNFSTKTRKLPSETNSSPLKQEDIVSTSVSKEVELEFQVKCLEKFLIANGIELPSKENLIELWKNGKKKKSLGISKTVITGEPLPDWYKETI